MDMNLNKLREIVKSRKGWHAAVHGVAELDLTWGLKRHQRTCALSCFTTWRPSKMGLGCKPGRGVWPEPGHADTLVSTLSFQNCEKNISVFQASRPGLPSTVCCDSDPRRPMQCPSMFSIFFLHFPTHLLLWTLHFLHFNSFLCNGFLRSFPPAFLDTSSFELFWWMYLFFYCISN